MKTSSKDMTSEMNLVALIEQFGSEDKCREYLIQLRWPKGVQCPRCDHKSLSSIVVRAQ